MSDARLIGVGPTQDNLTTSRTLLFVALMLQLEYIDAMSTIEEIENAIRQLPPEDLTAFRDWFAKYDAILWDAQIEMDVSAGRLDALANEALSDLRSGRCTDI